MASLEVAAEANGATTGQLSEQLRELRVQVTQKAEQVRLLKQANAPAEEIAAAGDALGQLRARVGAIEKHLESSRPLYYQLRTQCENLLKRRFFVAPAYEIYGGVGGLYDFGPPGKLSGCHLLWDETEVPVCEVWAGVGKVWAV